MFAHSPPASPERLAVANAKVTLYRLWGIISGGKVRHPVQMLKLVESLATKAKRAQATTVEFSPLGGTQSRKCHWCKKYVANPKGWASFEARDLGKGGVFKVTGDVCANAECRISIQARYSTAES